jgi:hypothetical protein
MHKQTDIPISVLFESSDQHTFVRRPFHILHHIKLSTLICLRAGKEPSKLDINLDLDSPIKRRVAAIISSAFDPSNQLVVR